MASLKNVLANVTEKQAEAIWKVLAAHIENLECDYSEEHNENTPEIALLKPVVDALDAQVASRLAEAL